RPDSDRNRGGPRRDAPRLAGPDPELRPRTLRRGAGRLRGRARSLASPGRMTTRPTPFDLVFGELADVRFPALERGIRKAGYDPKSRDAFTLVKEAVELLRELLPDEGMGAGMDDFVAFVHAGFAYWLDGRPIVQIDRETLDRVLRERALPAE